MKNVLLISAALAFAGSLIYFNGLWMRTPIPELVGKYIYQSQKASEYAAFASRLLASPAAMQLPVPVLGVRNADIADSYAAPRSGGRSHEGTDIFAPRGTYVLSATEGIVVRIGEGDLGGNYVFILGPAGERYYYAHFDRIDPLLEVGQMVSTTTVLGYVGTTGNASGTPPHLHLGVYSSVGPINPFDRLKP